MSGAERPPPAPARPEACPIAAIALDRNLLFGLLALQNGLINQGQLVAAFQAWSLDKDQLLADYLVARRDLNAAQRAAIEGLAALHIEKHGDAEKGLAAIPAGRSTRESLAQIGDLDLGGTLAHVGTASIELEIPRGTGRTSGGDCTIASRPHDRRLTSMHVFHLNCAGHRSRDRDRPISFDRRTDLINRSHAGLWSAVGYRARLPPMCRPLDRRGSLSFSAGSHSQAMPARPGHHPHFSVLGGPGGAIRTPWNRL